MRDDEFGIPTSVNFNNLDKLMSSGEIIAERRICEISELADIAVNLSSELRAEGMGIYEILSLISDEMAFSTPQSENLNSSFLKLSELSDKAAFCELYVQRMKKNGLPVSESELLQEFSVPSTFIYVKNPLSDEAYDVFSQEFKDPRLRYAKSLKEAVKAVGDGEVSYCLLPLEERGGARLSSITELIFGNDLKINSVTPVFGSDGTVDMKYALVSKYFSLPKIKKDDDMYLEICLSCSGTVSLSDILSAANIYGISPYRVNTFVIYNEDGQNTNYSIVFRKEGCDFTTLLVYLTLYADSFVPIGIYKNLE